MKAMKTMKAGNKAMTKGASTKALATQHEKIAQACSELLNSLVEIVKRGEEERYSHIPGLCRQDPREASHKGRCPHDVWSGKESEGKDSKDCCESVPSGCPNT